MQALARIFVADVRNVRYPEVMSPAPKTPQTFDQHLGSVVGGLAKAHGGRPFLVGLLDWSKGTVDRRIAGTAPFLVKEIEIVARALNTTPAAIAEQALRNFSGTGVEQDGLERLIAEERPDVVSEPPISISDQRRKKKPSEMTDDELEAFEGESAANTDPEIGHDQPELP